MKISNIELQGFRSLFDITWNPGDLNIVIGPNGSGKSNLLKALEMLSQSANRNLSRQVLLEGGMDSLTWNNQQTKIQFKILSTPLDPMPSGQRDSLTYQLDLTQIGSSSSYQIEQEILGDFSQFDRRFKPRPFIVLERTPFSIAIYNDQHQNLITLQEIYSQEETLLSSANNMFTTGKSLFAYNRWLSRWQIYRDFQTHRDAPVRQPVIDRMETSVSFDGSNLVQVLHTLYESNQGFNHTINTAMKAAFGKDFDRLTFPTVANNKIQLLINWKSSRRPQSMADLSDGTLRFLYLIAILANPNLPPLIAIDETETGLHPSMLPIIAEYARNASLRTQIILTTHSEEFLDTFSKFEPTVTIAKLNAEGKTRLDALSGESLRYWLKEYTFNQFYCNEEMEELV